MGTQVPLPKKGAELPPIFIPCLLWPNGWMEEGRPRPRPHCARWGPSFPSPKKGTTSNFQPMSVVAKRLGGSRCQLVQIGGTLCSTPQSLAPEENFWTLWCKGRLTEADTDHPAERHSIQTNQCPPPPSPFFTGQMPFLPPNQQCQSTEGN